MVMEEALARALWPDQDALGKCIKVLAPDAPCREVIGIVSNARRLVETREDALRWSLPLEPSGSIVRQALFVRSTGEPTRSADADRAALLELDLNLPFITMRTLEDMVEPQTRPWHVGSTIFVVFGAAALFVSTLGVSRFSVFSSRSRQVRLASVSLSAPAGHARYSS